MIWREKDCMISRSIYVIIIIFLLFYFDFLLKKMKAALILLHINVYNFTRVPGNYYEKLTIIKIKKKRQDSSRLLLYLLNS